MAWGNISQKYVASVNSYVHGNGNEGADTTAPK